MKHPKRPKPFWKMNADELAEATKQFDREIPDTAMRPLTKRQRAIWERAKRQPSRSIFVVDRTGKGTEPVVLELDARLLKRLDAYAGAHRMTRAQLIEKGLRSVLSFVEEFPPPRRTRKSA